MNLSILDDTIIEDIPSRDVMVRCKQ